MSQKRSSLKELDLRSNYASSDLGLLHSFYVPCLSAAVQYDRAVGYFRSTLYALTGVAMSEFARDGGHARIICSPRLTREDFDAMKQGYDLRRKVDERLTGEIEKILREPKNVPVVRFLSTLIAADVLEVRLVVKEDRAGLFHDKLGFFRDEAGNRVSFVGSVNETYSGWALEGNHENFEVFESWLGGREEARVNRHEEYFRNVWNNERTGLETFGIPVEARSILETYVCENGLERAAQAVRGLVKERRRAGYEGNGDSRGRELYEHQEEAVEQWLEAGGEGIVKHATGAGKTVTAIHIVKQWVEDNRPAVIVVPSLVLVDQWIEEAKVDLEGVPILRVSGESRDSGWRDRLADFTRAAEALGSRLTVTTLQTARTDDFRNRVQDGEHLLLVIDEVHRAGSDENGKIFQIDAGGRLGLSATPERYGDPEGTEKILDYHGGILDCEFSLRDAVESGRLVPYDYDIQEVELTDEEQSEWDDMTERVAKVFARLPEDASGNKQFSDHFKQLLINRARILKQASNKVDMAAALLGERYKSGERWLVYCDSQDQLERVVDALRAEGLPTYTYHSNMAGSRDATMNYFRLNPCILVAIRCLDEGVDVPAASAALVLASSSNPREYIQRRGRVLRTAPGKYSAEIHDALVLPRQSRNETGIEAILGTEIGRAAVFAELARNRGVRAKLRRIARRFGAELSDLLDDRLAYEAGNEREQ